MNRKKGAANTKIKIQHGGGGRTEGALQLLNSRREPGTRMSVLIANPDYLLEGFAEKTCQYIGALDNIPTSADMSNRNYLLAKLDDRRNAGKLPWRLSVENNVTVTLSAYNVKIIKDDRTGSILHRIPIHEIAAVSYVNDDDQHLVFIQAGDATKPQCPCHVLVCPKRADAEEICTILQQAFQLVFTEATMEHLNNSISAGERSSTFLSSSAAAAAGAVSVPGSGRVQGSRAPEGRAKSRPHKQRQKHQLPQASALVVPVGSSDSEDQTAVVAGYPNSQDSGSEGPTAEELVQKYMERLHKLLGFKELQEFATLLKSYRDKMPVEEFISKLQVLYGAQRAFLIPDLRSFIPEEDRATFDKFVQDHDLVNTRKSTTAHPSLVPSGSSNIPPPPTTAPPLPPPITSAPMTPVPPLPMPPAPPTVAPPPPMPPAPPNVAPPPPMPPAPPTVAPPPPMPPAPPTSVPSPPMPPPMATPPPPAPPPIVPPTTAPPTSAPPPPPVLAPTQGQSPQKRRKGRQQQVNDVGRFIQDIEADMNSVINSTNF